MRMEAGCGWIIASADRDQLTCSSCFLAFLPNSPLRRTWWSPLPANCSMQIMSVPVQYSRRSSATVTKCCTPLTTTKTCRLSAKWLYSSILDWLVRKINSAVFVSWWRCAVRVHRAREDIYSVCVREIVGSVYAVCCKYYLN